MLKPCRVTKVKVLFLVLVYVFNVNLFEFSAAILKKDLSVHVDEINMLCYALNGTWTFPQKIEQLPTLKRLWNFSVEIKLTTVDLLCSLFFSLFFLSFSDINDCDEDPDICDMIDKNSDCKNRRGGYECLCKSGFQPFYNNSVTPRVLVNCTGKKLLFGSGRWSWGGGCRGKGWGQKGKRRRPILLNENI